MAAFEAIPTGKSPGWRPAKRPGGLGSQKNGYPRKMTAREAKNTAIQEKRRPGKRKRRPGWKKRRRESSEDRRIANARAGPSARGGSRLLGARDSRRRRRSSLTSEVRQGNG